MRRLQSSRRHRAGELCTDPDQRNLDRRGVLPLDGSDPRQWGGALASAAAGSPRRSHPHNAVNVMARVLDGTTGARWSRRTFYVLQDYSRLVPDRNHVSSPASGPTMAMNSSFLELRYRHHRLDLERPSVHRRHHFTFQTESVAPDSSLSSPTTRALCRQVSRGRRQRFLHQPTQHGGEKITLAHVLGKPTFFLQLWYGAPWPMTPDGLGFPWSAPIFTGMRGWPELASQRPPRRVAWRRDPALVLSAVWSTSFLTRPWPRKKQRWNFSTPPPARSTWPVGS